MMEEKILPNKKIMILTMVLLGLIAISAASAAENTTGDVTSIEDQITEEKMSVSDEDVLETDDETFTALQNRIDDASEGLIIYLENNYMYNEGFDNDGIHISKTITIDGNGYCIDGCGKSRIFNIYSSQDITVTLNDIRFTNAYSQENGGAICADDGNLIVNGCNFTSNKAKNGAALYASATAMTMNNCRFTGNEASWRGGAIYSYGGNQRIENTNFISNVAYDYAGAIYYDGYYPYYELGSTRVKLHKCTVLNSNFIGNHAYLGSAIYANTGIIDGIKYGLFVEKSTFKQNVAVISSDDVIGVAVINCVFDDASASSKSSSGGSHAKATAKLTAKKATFKVKTKTKKYSVVLKTDKGKAMKNVKLYLKVNGKSYTAKTNSRGKATFKITKLTKKGKYKAVVTFKGNVHYNKVTRKVKITVK